MKWEDMKTQETWVPWKEFLNTFCGQCKPYGVGSAEEVDHLLEGQKLDDYSDLTIGALRHLKFCALFFALQANLEGRRVTRAAYERCEASFGPWGENGERLMDLVFQTFQLAGFAGFVDQTQAARILAQDRKIGMYVLRFGSQPHSFAFTFIGKDKQFHSTRVERHGASEGCPHGEFSIGDHRFDRWSRVIEYMSRHTDCRVPSPRARAFWDSVRYFQLTQRTAEEADADSNPEDVDYVALDTDEAHLSALEAALESKYTFTGLQAGSTASVRYALPGAPLRTVALFELRVGRQVESSIRHSAPPVDLVVALDRSHSMSGRRFQHAKDGVRQVIRELLPEDSLTLLAFDKGTHVVFLSEPAAKSEEMLRQLDGLEIGSGTDIGAALAQSFEILREHPNPHGRRVRRLFLISDGQSTSGERRAPPLVALATEAYAQDGIQTSCFGIGEGFDEALLQSLAASSSGRYSYSAHAEDLGRSIAETFLLTRRLVGSKAVVLVEPEPGVRVVRVEPAVCAADETSLYVGDVRLSSYLQMLVELESQTPNVAVDSRMKLCTFRARFEPLSAELDRPNVASECSVVLTRDPALLKRSPNKMVEGARLAYDAATELTQVLSLLDQNRPQEALVAKRKQLALLRDACSLRPSSEIEIAFIKARREFPALRKLLSDDSRRAELRKHVHYDIYSNTQYGNFSLTASPSVVHSEQ